MEFFCLLFPGYMLFIPAPFDVFSQLSNSCLQLTVFCFYIGQDFFGMDLQLSQIHQKMVFIQT